jgi:hypothetical protein
MHENSPYLWPEIFLVNDGDGEAKPHRLLSACLNLKVAPTLDDALTLQQAAQVIVGACDKVDKHADPSSPSPPEADANYRD